MLFLLFYKFIRPLTQTFFIYCSEGRRLTAEEDIREIVHQETLKEWICENPACEFEGMLPFLQFHDCNFIVSQKKALAELEEEDRSSAEDILTKIIRREKLKLQKNQKEEEKNKPQTKPAAQNVPSSSHVNSVSKGIVKQQKSLSSSSDDQVNNLQSMHQPGVFAPSLQQDFSQTSKIVRYIDNDSPPHSQLILNGDDKYNNRDINAKDFDALKSQNNNRDINAKDFDALKSQNNSSTIVYFSDESQGGYKKTRKVQYLNNKQLSGKGNSSKNSIKLSDSGRQGSSTSLKSVSIKGGKKKLPLPVTKIILGILFVLGLVSVSYKILRHKKKEEVITNKTQLKRKKIHINRKNI